MEGADATRNDDAPAVSIGKSEIAAKQAPPLSGLAQAGQM
jgi:hypothetical protein